MKTAHFHAFLTFLHFWALLALLDIQKEPTYKRFGWTSLNGSEMAQKCTFPPILAIWGHLEPPAGPEPGPRPRARARTLRSGPGSSDPGPWPRRARARVRARASGPQIRGRTVRSGVGPSDPRSGLRIRGRCLGSVTGHSHPWPVPRTRARPHSAASVLRFLLVKHS